MFLKINLFSYDTVRSFLDYIISKIALVIFQDEKVSYSRIKLDSAYTLLEEKYMKKSLIYHIDINGNFNQILLKLCQHIFMTKLNTFSFCLDVLRRKKKKHYT